MPDMIVGWEQHLKNGNLWRGEVELAMQGGETDEQLTYTVEVFVVSPTQELAQYIISNRFIINNKKFVIWIHCSNNILR